MSMPLDIMREPIGVEYCLLLKALLTVCSRALLVVRDDLTISATEIQALDAKGLTALSRASGFAANDLRQIVASYEPGGSPAFYRFVCRHCARAKYNGDCD